ncbi:MAG TPA: hypothetical protein VFG54_04145 [Prolixibacteraceae bacterium]|nr:hypothetical protein [Prolixibacteraceae bacterium]
MLKLPKAVSGILSNDERIVFYLVLIINIAYLFYTRFYPSMDGPAHLYNSNLLKQLVLNNSFISEFYRINPFPVPNWTGHFILSFFKLFLPGWLSEKMLLVLYISGMALSFRYLIKVLIPENLSLSVFIFPFIYTFLFHMGFYNYSLSFIFLFLTLGFWIKNYDANQPRLYVITGLLLLGAYFSNILTFAFTGILIGCMTLLFEAKTKAVKSKQYFKASFNRIVGLTIASFPSLILLFWFFHTVSFPQSIHQYAASELLKWTNDVRSLIVYSYSKEEIITEQFFHILLFLYLISFFFNRPTYNIRSLLSNPGQLIAYFPLLLAVVFLFVLPDGSSAGMMSDRLSLMVFILLIILVVTQKLPYGIQSLTSVLIISLHLILLTKHSVTLNELDRNAKTIHTAAQHIQDNTVVLPVNLSDNWLEIHFSNYLGADKPLVIVENYEAQVGWFPVQWNPQAPKILLGEKGKVDALEWHQSTTNETRQVDYIFLYGNTSKIQEDKWKELNEAISSRFTLEYESENKYIQLYKRVL